jgi:hypothetical protein
MKIMNELFTEVWADKDTISVDHTETMTLSVWILCNIFSTFSFMLNTRLPSSSFPLQVITISLLFHTILTIAYRIWAKNVMARGQDCTKGAPDVDDRGTPHRLYGNFLQAFAPGLGFEPYQANTYYQGRF